MVPIVSVARRLSENRRLREPLDQRDPASRSTLSIIIPAKNEAPSLHGLVDEINQAFRPLVARPTGQGNRLAGYEILIIDDGSTDQTPQVLRDLAESTPELRPVLLRKTRGNRRPHWRASARRVVSGWRSWTPTCRIRRPSWRGFGTPYRGTMRRLAGASSDKIRPRSAGLARFPIACGTGCWVIRCATPVARFASSQRRWHFGFPCFMGRIGSMARC